MSVSGVSPNAAWSWIYNQQTPTLSKTDAIIDNTAAAEAARKTNEVAMEQQASNRGDGVAIDKLA